MLLFSAAHNYWSSSLSREPEMCMHGPFVHMSVSGNVHYVCMYVYIVCGSMKSVMMIGAIYEEDIRDIVLDIHTYFPRLY